MEIILAVGGWQWLAVGAVGTTFCVVCGCLRIFTKSKSIGHAYSSYECSQCHLAGSNRPSPECNGKSIGSG